MKDFAKRFYKSTEWQTCREGFIIFKHGLCERCGGVGNTVHHKKELTPMNIHDPYISLNWNNLELLCPDCHNKHHKAKYAVTREGLMFNDRGELVRVD